MVLSNPDVLSLADRDSHFTRRFAKGLDWDKDLKGRMGEAVVMGILRSKVSYLGYDPNKTLLRLLNSSDPQTMFAENPTTGEVYFVHRPVNDRRVWIQESHKYPDILFLGNARPFLFEVRNLFVCPGYRIRPIDFATGENGVAKKAWGERFYPLRDDLTKKLKGRVQRKVHGSSKWFRRAVDLAEFYPLSELAELTHRAYVSTVPWYSDECSREIERTFRGGSMHFSYHPIMLPGSALGDTDPECTSEMNDRLGMQLLDMIRAKENKS